MANVKLKGHAKATQSLKRKLTALGVSTRRVFGQKELEQRTLKRVKRRYLQEVDPDGKPWTPLHPSTRKRHGIAGPSQILIDSGNMYKDIQVIRGTTANGPGTVKVNTGAGFRIGVPNTKYAALHQYGSEDVPARPFIGLNRADVKSLIAMIGRMLKGKRVRI